MTVDNRRVGAISRGLCIFLGVGVQDDEKNAAALADKIAKLRIFEDDQGKMNRSVSDIDGALLVVSQFTLYGDCRKGNRPSFSDAAPPERAEKMYGYFSEHLRHLGFKVVNGQFQAHMKVDLCNDGPVTFVLEI